MKKNTLLSVIFLLISLVCFCQVSQQDKTEIKKILGKDFNVAFQGGNMLITKKNRGLRDVNIMDYRRSFKNSLNPRGWVIISTCESNCGSSNGNNNSNANGSGNGNSNNSNGNNGRYSTLYSKLGQDRAIRLNRIIKKYNPETMLPTNSFQRKFVRKIERLNFKRQKLFLNNFRVLNR